MARPVGDEEQFRLEVAAGDGRSALATPVPFHDDPDEELDPVEAANLAEDAARMAVDGLPVRKRDQARR